MALGRLGCETEKAGIEKKDKLIAVALGRNIAIKIVLIDTYLL